MGRREVRLEPGMGQGCTHRGAGQVGAEARSRSGLGSWGAAPCGTPSIKGILAPAPRLYRLSHGGGCVDTEQGRCPSLSASSVALEMLWPHLVGWGQNELGSLVSSHPAGGAGGGVFPAPGRPAGEVTQGCLVPEHGLGCELSDPGQPRARTPRLCLPPPRAVSPGCGAPAGLGSPASPVKAPCGARWAPHWSEAASHFP